LKPSTPSVKHWIKNPMFDISYVPGGCSSEGGSIDSLKRQGIPAAYSVTSLYSPKGTGHLHVFGSGDVYAWDRPG
jgi:hypothetical protein